MTVKESGRHRVCVCLCVGVEATEMLMPLLWALSSTLIVSVYNEQHWEKLPVIPGGLKAAEA